MHNDDDDEDVVDELMKTFSAISLLRFALPAATGSGEKEEGEEDDDDEAAEEGGVI